MSAMPVFLPFILSFLEEAQDGVQSSSFLISA